MAEETPKDSAADWLSEIKLAQKRDEKFVTRGKKIVKRYRDERADSETTGGSRRMNLLYSNVKTLKPSIYGRAPQPVCERRFLDKDTTGRVASQMLERAIRYEIEDCGFHEAVDQAVLDYLLPGRGTAWVRFIPTMGPATSPENSGDDEVGDSLPKDDSPSNKGPDDYDASEDPTDDEQLVGAQLGVDYVNWLDFGHSMARTWEEVTWVKRDIYMGRADATKRFGKKLAGKMSYSMMPDANNPDKRADDRASDSMKKAIVHEIWYKPTREVIFVSDGCDEVLERVEDPLGLRGFWPCPRPLFATITNDTLTPVADYIEYQDQAQEIDDLTERMTQLIKALKVAGVYDSSQKELARLLDEGVENRLIPVPSWAAFAAKGGLASAISFLPIKEIADVLSSLSEAREQSKKDLYEITGLSDVMRGQADPNETATAVTTKGRWGSLRLQERQKEVARFCRDIVCMMGEIISEHFPDQTLIDVSGVMYDEGIGDPMPSEPTKPTALAIRLAAKAVQTPPAPPPQMGHNGGPPMQQAGPMAPPNGPLGLPNGAPPPHPMAPLPQQNAAVPPAQPGVMGPPPPGVGIQPSAPPPPNPVIVQYTQDMADYHQDMEAWLQDQNDAVQRAIALLRSDKLRGFRLDIETDSTIQDDASDEAGGRVKFLDAMSGYLEKAMQAGAQSPEMVPILGKMVLFVARGFRTGRDLEGSLEEFIDTMEKKAKQTLANPPPPKPDPEAIKAQADQAKAQAEIEAQKVEAASEAANNQARMQEKQFDAQQTAAQNRVEQEKIQQQMALQREAGQLKLQELHLQAQADREKIAADLQMTRMKMAGDEQKARLDAHTAAVKAHVDSARQGDPNAPVAGAVKSPVDGHYYVPDHGRSVDGKPAWARVEKHDV